MRTKETTDKNIIKSRRLRKYVRDAQMFYKQFIANYVEIRTRPADDRQINGTYWEQKLKSESVHKKPSQFSTLQHTCEN